MTKQVNKPINLKFQFTGLFFFSYFGLGALLPLLSVYLEDIGFTGVQIGSIFSIRAIMAIFAPPIWGLISDRYNNHKFLLLVTFIATLVVSFFMPFATTFVMFAFVYAIFNFFQTASTPLSDSLALHSPIPFGDIRKWGAYGFAIAALATGYITRVIDMYFIFVVFGASCLAAILYSAKLNVKVEHESHDLKGELKLLIKNKKFIIFLVYCFLVGNTLISHNTFFGLLYESLGGGTGLIGLAFFLFAVSEAPFMQLSNKLIIKYGVYNVLIFSTAVGMIRWFFYFTRPSTFIILLLFPLQGMFFGTFLSATAHYIKTTVNPSVRSTAVTIYSSVFIGIGGAFSNYIGGYIYDYINIESVYGFFGILCLLGLILIIIMKHTFTQKDT